MILYPSRVTTLCLLIFVLLGNNLWAQNGVGLLNYHTQDCNKRDLNQIYINSKTSKAKNIDSSFFADGFIIRALDTIKCKLYLPKHKINDDCYLYIIAKLPNDSFYVLTPKDISGYSVAGITMKAHRSISSGDTSYYFIQLLEKGAVILFGRAGVPDDEEYVYYFEKPGDKDLLFFAPDKKSDIYTQESYNKDSPMISKYNGPDEKQFMAALSEYLKDCNGIHNKILAKIYTINDIETIIKEYNKCKK